MENILIKSADVNTASNGNKYLNMNIVFNNEEYNAKYWDYLRLNKDVKQVLKKDLPAVFSVDMEENYFNDNKQYIINKFYNYPAARNVHNAYLHGLLEHTYHMLVFADQLLYGKIYQEDFALDTYLQDDEFLNKPLIFAGILLHDVAKIFEWEEEQAKFGIGINNDKGKLLGHIYNGAELVDSLDCDEEIKMKLKHIILSHHKKKEWGSPIEPKIPEAWFVHLIDYLDSRMQIIRE